MVVLGIVDSKPSSAAIVINGQIAAAVAEERLCRMKLASGMPRQAIGLAMEIANVTQRDIDQVAVAQRVSAFAPEPLPWTGWFVDDSRSQAYAFNRASAALAPLIGRSPLAWKVHHGVKGLVSRDRLHKIPVLLRQAYDLTAPVRFYDHHECHATSAYYTSGLERALVVTLDGGGDGRSGAVYIGEGGRLRRLASVDSFNSLGNLYAYVTHLCGFQAENHEGKVTGLAALGQPSYADVLRQFVHYRAPGQIRYRVPMYHQSAVRLIRARLPARFDRADLAASVQHILEEIGTAFVSYWLRQTNLRALVVAGGVFANVKLNQRLHELEGVDQFFVHPAMDDSGLSVGSALAALVRQPQGQPAHLIGRLPNVYLGPQYGEAEIERSLAAAGCRARYDAQIQHTVANLLARGHVVARFTGRMEYGPRALGHRTIYYQTTDPSVNNWLNARLQRTEFMPFAPATLTEYAARCYTGLSGADDAARFMTITFNCTPTLRAESPGVVHADGTARPQLVDAQSAPDMYRIISAYHRLTGIPSLINTSFNMHGEPIVCTPDDALRSFQQGNLDYLALNNWLVEHPKPSSRHDQWQATSKAFLAGGDGE